MQRKAFDKKASFAFILCLDFKVVMLPSEVFITLTFLFGMRDYAYKLGICNKSSLF